MGTEARVRKPERPVKISAKTVFSEKEVEYYIPCPREGGSRGINMMGPCVGCDYKVAFDSLDKHGKRSIGVICEYPCLEMTDAQYNDYQKTARIFYKKGPRYQKPEEDEEVDELIDRHLSHFHPHARSEID